MAAPVASHGGAVVDDPGLLRLAEAVIAAFGQGEIDNGLTRSQIVERVMRLEPVDPVELDRRLDTFVELEMLLPYRDKAHQQRYVINTDAVAGSLFFRKGLGSGGIEELLQLLGSTADAIEAGRQDIDTVANALVEQRGYVEMWTSAVNRLTDTATLEELLAERSHHDGDRMMNRVERLVGVVTKHHPSLRVSATAVLTAAESYLMATQRLVERVIDEGASTRDFSLLDPAEYARLATTGTVEVLAAVFSGVVWDPPRPFVSPPEVVRAMRAYRPTQRQARRPPVEPDDGGQARDPLEGLGLRRERVRKQIEHRAELLLQGESSVELSAHLRATPWPGALRAVVDFSGLATDPNSPYQLDLADTLVVDTEAHTTWASDARLGVTRRSTRQSEPASKERKTR